MHRSSRAKNLVTTWGAIFALGVILIPGTAMAADGRDAGSLDGWRQLVARVVRLIHPAADGLLAVFEADGTEEDQRGAGNGTGKPAETPGAAGEGTGKPTDAGQRSAGSGTGRG